MYCVFGCLSSVVWTAIACVAGGPLGFRWNVCLGAILDFGRGETEKEEKKNYKGERSGGDFAPVLPYYPKLTHGCNSFSRAFSKPLPTEPSVRPRNLSFVCTFFFRRHGHLRLDFLVHLSVLRQGPGWQSAVQRWPHGKVLGHWFLHDVSTSRELSSAEVSSLKEK